MHQRPPPYVGSYKQIAFGVVVVRCPVCEGGPLFLLLFGRHLVVFLGACNPVSRAKFGW